MSTFSMGDHLSSHILLVRKHQTNREDSLMLVSHCQQGSSLLNYSTFYPKPNSFQKLRLLVSEICAQFWDDDNNGDGMIMNVCPKLDFLRKVQIGGNTISCFFRLNATHFRSQTFQIEIKPILAEILFSSHQAFILIFIHCFDNLE